MHTKTPLSLFLVMNLLNVFSQEVVVLVLVCVLLMNVNMYREYEQQLTLGGEDKSNNQPVEPQNLSENEDEDHSHKQARLLGCAPNTCITNNSNGEAGRKTTQTNAQPSAKVQEAPRRHRAEDILFELFLLVM